ncbi:MAG: TraR/DksA family transcriptional regulator [Candidatus Dadabacteria bacterium]|nr:TraR/DksA family transcriptional regulator [Candidatus Dadabacteria bacterium]NIS07916.1 TraR/DksA family transcriptional regulator [Candidatus Dadabacteria bacterium]NIV41213.1 hypothetical protein [Candidatus Dadabacteria bacterium]NIY21503.1 hypothetical protein [Candidatus Dadabacteria bacterium]
MPRQKKTDTEETKKTTRAAKAKKTGAAGAKKTAKTTAAKKTKSTNASTVKPKPRRKAKASDWKDEIKEMLEQMKKELMQDVVKSIKDESDYLKNDVGDFYDHASNDRDRELALMFTDRERTKLVQIDEALKRIEEGGYGECDNCMDEIGEDRLSVMPFAKLCLSCKIELERHGEL